MRLTNRITALERASAARTGGSIGRHWERRNLDRLRRLGELADALPESHADALEDVLLTAVAPALFVDGPAWLPDDAPAVARWAMAWVEWGADHPDNRALPAGGPVPAALLDLLLAHPAAELADAGCGCGTPLPTAPRPDHAAGWDPVRRPLAAACPVCGRPTVTITAAGTRFPTAHAADPTRPPTR